MSKIFLPGELLGILEPFVREAGIREVGILLPLEAGAPGFPNPISSPPRALTGSYSSPV